MQAVPSAHSARLARKARIREASTVIRLASSRPLVRAGFVQTLLSASVVVVALVAPVVLTAAEGAFQRPDLFHVVPISPLTHAPRLIPTADLGSCLERAATLSATGPSSPAPPAEPVALRALSVARPLVVVRRLELSDGVIEVIEPRSYVRLAGARQVVRNDGISAQALVAEGWVHDRQADLSLSRRPDALEVLVHRLG